MIDTARMVATMHYRAAGESFYGGLAAVRDPSDPSRTLVFAAGGASNAVYAFDLDPDGRLVPDARHAIAIPGPSDAGFADRGISFPSALLASADGRRVYVVDAGGQSVAAIDVATRRLLAPPHRVGFSPSGAAIAGSRLLVTNEGLMRYGLLPAPVAIPPFERLAADPLNASSLSLLDLDAGGGIAGIAGSLPMDPMPDGLRLVGGAHPTAIVATTDNQYAFVAMTNVDRIATVALGASPHVAGGTELRLFDRGPYGTQPSALALSSDASRLYVALTGLNAIAVIDARDPLASASARADPDGLVAERARAERRRPLAVRCESERLRARRRRRRRARRVVDVAAHRPGASKTSPAPPAPRSVRRATSWPSRPRSRKRSTTSW